LIFLTTSCGKSSDSESIFEIKLSVLNTKQEFLFHSLKENVASVFVFLSPDCPISQRYPAELMNLSKKYSASHVRFYGIIPGDPAGYEFLTTFVDDYKISFPVVVDEEYELAKRLEASITPEVFVVDGAGKTRYSGMIDNKFVDLGKQRTVVTEKYLEDAIVAIVENKKIHVTKTKAIGCYIYPSGKIK
jgi:thiol-disulfide isomerase/thioredoxin